MIGVCCSLGVLLQRIMANYRVYPLGIRGGSGCFCFSALFCKDRRSGTLHPAVLVVWLFH